MNRIERIRQHPWPLKLVIWLVIATQLLVPFQGQILASSAVADATSSFSHSPRDISGLADLAWHYRNTCQFSKALEIWQEVWAKGRDITDPDGRRIVDEAACELSSLLSVAGRTEELHALTQELKRRDLHGPSAVKLQCAEQSLWLMQHQPERAFKCGPYAVAHLGGVLGILRSLCPEVERLTVATNGTSLAENWMLAKKLGISYQMAKRQRETSIPLPALVHWNLGHYSILTQFKNGCYKIEDSACLNGWISAKVLDEESSGYFLIPAGPLPFGWARVGETEGGAVWGKGKAYVPDYNIPPCPPAGGGYAEGGDTQPCKGMAQYTVNLLLVTLNVADVPVGYRPPLGPPVEFRVTYNEMQTNQAASIPTSTLGSNWNFEWLSYVQNHGVGGTNKPVTLVGGSGSSVVFQYASSNGGNFYYVVDPMTQATLTGVNVGQTNGYYQCVYPDGSTNLYGQTNANGSYLLMTQKIDPTGNALTFNYDSNYRLTNVTDAIGQGTTLYYGSTNVTNASFYLITNVTDPFLRSATFQYNTNQQLTNITDEIGITSSFAYASASEPGLITSLTTPYGTTTFTNSSAPQINGSGTMYGRWIQITDPLGAQEMVEYSPLTLPSTNPAPSYEVPLGFSATTAALFQSSRTTYYWDKTAMQQYPGIYSKAKSYVWVEANYANDSIAEPIPACVIKPLESAVFYTYPGQPSSLGFPDIKHAGTNNEPSEIARVLDDGTTQSNEYSYNAIGKPTEAVDPMGRTTLFTYAANNIDLLTVSQVAGRATNLLGQFTYNSQHLPLTAVDATGQTNFFAYNASGQLIAATNALNQVITLTYSNGYLTNITGALTNATTSFTYDGYGRVRTVTDSEGYTVTYSYDALDRPTNVTYPDGTYQAIVYQNLDPVMSRDRNGRWTTATYNAQRQLTAILDALGRVTSFQRCTCGALESITDPLGRTTTFLRDLEKRVTTKIYPDDTHLDYAYENSTSRLHSVTDAKNQTTVYTYFEDNNLAHVNYSNAVISTPSVSFTYDTNYNRLLTMTDGTGTTTYGYYPVTNGQLGAGRLASVTNPFPNSTVTYSYDQLGRVSSRAINGVVQTVTYDALGRVTNVINALGSFTNSYVDATARISTNFYPNGQTTVFSYFSIINDERLQQIQNLNPSGQNLSTFGYIYDADGDITNWTEQTDANVTNVQVLQYDPVNQLLDSTMYSNSVAGTILKQFLYTYDKAGNRTGEQIQPTAGVSPSITSGSYNTLNQLGSQTGTNGSMRFQGSLNQAGTVTIAGIPAIMTSPSNFLGYANVTPGTNYVQIIASNYSGYSSNATYKIVVTNSGVADTITYDLNGNETSDITATATNLYQWDAANRLVSITGSTNQSLFTYDGLGRRTQIIELQNGAAVSTNIYLWCGMELCEERSNTGGTVVKRFFGEGEQMSGTNYYFTRDHLGSIREMVDGSGTVQARYDYDPYGVRTKISGSLDADFAYAGYYYHAASGLYLTLFRAYDSGSGRWLSRDPIQEEGGINLYAYVGGNPLNSLDPLGLSFWSCFGQGFVAGAISTALVGFGAVAITAFLPALAGVVTAGLLVGAAYGTFKIVQDMVKNNFSPNSVGYDLGSLTGGLVTGFGASLIGGGFSNAISPEGQKSPVTGLAGWIQPWAAEAEKNIQLTAPPWSVPSDIAAAMNKGPTFRSGPSSLALGGGAGGATVTRGGGGGGTGSCH